MPTAPTSEWLHPPGSAEERFDTLIVTTAGAVFPARSRATAVRAWAPFATSAVFQATEYGAVVSSGPIGAPSARNCTPATASLSDAFAVNTTGPETVAPGNGDVIETTGLTVSIEKEDPVMDRLSNTAVAQTDRCALATARPI